ncbi:UvrD-helicase domain-containing protein [Flavobacterium piscinae]|nr:UvrD-helicase domain-containing protein [Flavobacterium piscinae]
MTILGKVKYLLEQKKVKLENILLLSFTKKTVEELNERLQK